MSSSDAVDANESLQQGLEFSVNWLGSEQGSDPERVSYGALKFCTAQAVLTEVIDTIAQTTRTSIRVSLNQLALWFTENWWRLRWEPAPKQPALSWRMSHEMGAVGGGFVWPDISFASDGETVRIVARASKGKHTIRYLRDHDLSCSAIEFERAVDAFLSQVIARQLSCGASDAVLHHTWNIILEERSDPEASAFRKREALMGLNAGDTEEDELERLFAKGSWIGKGALNETLVDTNRDGAAGLVSQLEILRDALLPQLRFGGVLKAVERWQPDLGEGVPWRRAASLAQHLRELWGLGRQPLSDDFLNETLGADIHAADIGRSTAPLSLAFRDGDKLRPALRATRFRTNRRFDIARLIADAAVADPSDALYPLTQSRTARQKFQRAAAQELLCPFDALIERLSVPSPDEEELAAAADYFQVSEQLVTMTLVNHGRLPRDYLAWPF